MTIGVQALFASIPILIILVLMLGLRWSAAKAGGLGLLATLVLAFSVFGLGSQILPHVGAPAAAFGSLAEAAFIAATILWIVFPALCIHELQMATGAVETLRQAMGRLSKDPRILALLVAWFFVLFMEGAAGFGTSAALAAPFLVGAGFRAVEAVAIVLVGHAVGVSFGAVGTPILPQAATTGFGELELSAAAAGYHGLLGWIMPFIVIILVSRTLSPDKRHAKAIWLWTLLAAFLFLVPFYLIATFVGPELPTLGASLLGGMAFVAALWLAAKVKPAAAGSAAVGETIASGETVTSGETMPSDATEAAASADAHQQKHSAGALVRAAAPYLSLVALVLLTRLVPPVRQVIVDVAITWQLDVFSGRMAVLYHPGTLLLCSFALGAISQRAHWQLVRQAMAKAARRLLPVSLALLAMLGLSRLMVHAGMIDSLAQSAAGAAGSWWPLFAPFVGVLGTFVTGSATASNILFTDFQQVTAERLELPVVPLLGAQTFGAAVGNIICPHNIIAAGATVHLVGCEGDVLRRTLLPTCLYAGLGGLLAFFVFT